MQNIIEVSSLTKQFQHLTAVDDLSFTVQNGDVYGFLGQNGAGKSTTIRMLLTLITPTKGNIKLFGLDLQENRRKILQQVGAIIEKPDVYQYLSAFENLKLFARLSSCRLSNEKLMAQLEAVNLLERAHDKVKEFSQGMKQRLGIAISLIHNPQLLILDEPTNGLDPQGIADIRNLILHLSREQKKTIFISSHLLTEVEQIATRILIINEGKKLAEGTAEELFHPSQTIVEIETENNDNAFIQLKESGWANNILSDQNHHIILKMHRKDLPELHIWLVQHNVRLITLQSRHSLEDYFLQVTSGKEYAQAFAN